MVSRAYSSSLFQEWYFKGDKLFFSSMILINHRTLPSATDTIGHVHTINMPMVIGALQRRRWTPHCHHLVSSHNAPTYTCFGVDEAADEISPQLKWVCVIPVSRHLYENVFMCGFLPFRFCHHRKLKTWSISKISKLDAVGNWPNFAGFCCREKLKICCFLAH